MSSHQQRSYRYESEKSTLGYAQIYNQKKSILDNLNQRKTLQFVHNNFDTFQIIERAPYHMFSMIKQSAQNIKQNQDGLVGYGGFGQVFFAEHIIGMACVVKIQKIDDLGEFLQQLNEYKIQQNLNKLFPQNFVELIDKVTILQENISSFCSYAGLEIALTTLEEYSLSVKIDYEEFRSIYHQILKSILIMHSLKIAHRDIKPSNILYMHNKGWVIGDFGCALKYANQKGVFKIEGTTQFLPKMLRGLLKGYKSSQSYMNLFENDIYAFLLTMLKIYLQDHSIYQLQNILDDQSSIQKLPIEFQILSKNISQINFFLEQGIHKITLQKKFYEEKYNSIRNTLLQIKKKSENIIPFLFNLFYFHRRTASAEYQEFIKIEAKNNKNLKIYIEILQPYFRKIESTGLPQLTSSITFEQYQIISQYWVRLGNINKSLQLCRQYLQFSVENQFKLKIYEISILLFQEDYHEVDQLISKLEDDEQNMDDITFIQLQIIKAIRGKQWLEVADQFEIWVNDNLIYADYKENWFFLIHGNFSWIYLSSIVKHYYTPKNQKTKEMVNDENLKFSLSSSNLPRWVELCSWKGLDYFNSLQDMIKQLEFRGADSYGIKYFIQQLIKRIDLSDDKQKIINLFEVAIIYYQHNFPNSHYLWELYFHYSQYCFSIKEFQKSLELSFIALKLVDLDDKYFYIQIELTIIGILTKQNKFEESQERITKFWPIISEINSKKSRSILLQKLHSIFTIFFQNKQIQCLELIYNDLFKFQELEQDNSIILQCLRYIADLAFFTQNTKQMIKIFQSWIPYCQETQDFDQYLFQLFHKYVYVQKMLKKTDSQNQQYLYELGKYIQNLIVYDEIIGLKEPEQFNIQSFQWQFLEGAECFQQQEQFKQMAMQQQNYINLNQYQDVNQVQNLQNIEINYK
ncbi:unnamed protein product [Paramecium sonneborni]|uniref:Protein kinase domain-containing protein n=1 Tax=Paramecium sonneborni TaxID=65129 RepID=A0A8S1PZ13_9CILI|nr:unnamed protein product [Paramecium sonneborni]